MRENFPTRVSFDRNQLQRKWGKHPDLFQELKRFIDRSLEEIAAQVLAAGPMETDRQIEVLGSQINDWIFQFDPDNSIQKQVLMGRLKAKFDVNRVGRVEVSSIKKKVRILTESRRD